MLERFLTEFNFQGQNILQGFDVFCFSVKKLRMFSNMLGRDRGRLPRDNACYDCGFPCRPFSLLNTSEFQSLFAADDAEIFRETVRTVYSNEPLLCVLENVLGLLRVFNVVEKYLNKLTAFRWCYLVIDPRRLGDALSRRRVYFILVHKPLTSITGSIFVSCCCHVALVSTCCVFRLI